MRTAFYDIAIGANPPHEFAQVRRVPVSSTLVDLMSGMSEPTITFDGLAAALGERAIGMVLLLLGLIAALPGASALAGIAIACVAVRLLLGCGAAALPPFLAGREIGGNSLVSAVRIAIPPLRYFERFIRPRSWLFGDTAERGIGAAILLMDVFLFLPIPFSNVAPAMMITLLALAYLENDGILLGISLAGSVIMLTIAPILIWRVAELML